MSPASLAAHLTQDETYPWVPAPHLQIISERVVAAAMGRSKRIIINSPPRHGKSLLISKWTPVWYLENWPHLNVINCGYGDEFAKEWGAQVRDTVAQYQHKLSFQLSNDSKAADRWKTTAGGGMKTAGIGGGITGRGANLMVIDDPIKTDAQANSLTYRDQLWNWYRGTARTRIEPGVCTVHHLSCPEGCLEPRRNDGAIILLMTRWHDDDLAGRLIRASEDGSGEKWEVVNLPAVAGTLKPDTDPGDPANWISASSLDVLGRSPGQSLWPGRFGLQALVKIMKATGPENWAAQFQGIPANQIGAGNVYKSFNNRNLAGVRFNPKLPLIWTLDFNVDPMCSVILQIDEAPDEWTHLTSKLRQTICILQEMSLPNSNTLEACEEFCNRTEEYVQAAGGLLRLKVYGDRSGDSRKTSGETDYASIREYFRLRRQYSVTTHIQRANPSVKDRVNCVNAMLYSAANEVHTLIHPDCVELIQDFREVKWKKDSAGNTTGNIDKTTDPKRTHMSDAFGYLVVKEFGMRSRAGEMQGIMQ